MMPEDLKGYYSPSTITPLSTLSWEAMLLGGYAFGVHAEPRATKNLDLFIRPDEENSQALFRALAQYGAPFGGLSPQLGNPSNY